VFPGQLRKKSFKQISLETADAKRSAKKRELQLLKTE
jgi:hypothetical protein